MLHVRRHRCILLLLIILLLDISGMLKQYTSASSTNEEEFFNEPEDAESLFTSANEVSHKFRILADSPTSSSSGLQFCVAESNADPNALQDGLNWACSAGLANCTAVQPGGACYQPNNLVTLASYAYNDYYQMTKDSGGSCNFNNTAMLTFTDPSYGSCIFTGSSSINTGSNLSFSPPPPPILGLSPPSIGSSPPFNLNNSACDQLQTIQMPYLIIPVFLYLYMFQLQQF